MTGPLAKPINELEVSVRVHNCLENLGIQNVMDLMRYSERELLLCPNFGETSMSELRDVLYELGLTLPKSPTPFPDVPVPPPDLPDVVVREIERVTANFRKRRISIEMRKWQQKRNKALRDNQKKPPSAKAIAAAQTRAMYRERDRIVALLVDAKQTFAWIAKLLSISPARIRQIYFTTKRRQRYEQKSNDEAA